MRVGSLFSGVGGFDLGLERAGHRIVFQAESDPYRRRVLKRHWPDVPCYEDVHDVGRHSSAHSDEHLQQQRPADGSVDAVDLICGGFPCQDLSVAGRRAGLDGARSGLFFEFARIADDLLADGGWVLIENVPGLLSSHGGRDFAVLLATLGELGFYDLAWRVLDSRYFGVPQRRRRVFILARRARGRRASEVLLEPESGGGDFEAGRAAGPRVAESPMGGSDRFERGESYYVEDFENGTLTAAGDGTGPPRSDRKPLIAGPLTTRYGKGINTTADDGAAVVSDRVRAPAELPRGLDVGAQFVSENQRAELRLTDYARQLTGGGGKPGQGYPAVIGHGDERDTCALDPRPDGPRYAACGDAVTVNVAYWIGTRLQ